MRILVTGVTGQLGYDVVEAGIEAGHTVLGISHAQMDITDADNVHTIVEQAAYNGGVDVLIHCAAYTAVDRAEDEEEQCRLVNYTGTMNLAQVCAEYDIAMLYISTDYVFGGLGSSEWETDSKVAPLNVYGKSKADAEHIIECYLKKYYIVRTSWVYGLHGSNFVKTMLRLGEERKEVSVVADQVGAPTYTKDLAHFLIQLVKTQRYGIYHATNEGECSWYEFACEIFKQRNYEIEVHPLMTEQYPTRAARPHNSRLSKASIDEAGLNRLPDWKDALQRFLEELE